MNKENLISVIIPIYNADRYLSRCLESLISQTYENFEVILIDDGSIDRSGEICKSYVKKDTRFKYVYQHNSGPDIARKKGTEKAQGEYVVYVDADDYITADALEIMSAKAVETDADIICSQIIRFNEKSEWEGSKSRDKDLILRDRNEILRAFFDDEILIGTYYAKLIRKSVIDNYSFIEDALVGEDISAALYMFETADSVVVIPERTYYYYQNSNSISHAKYSPRHAVSLDNYIRLRDQYLADSIIESERICGYFAGYQMAVATAMGRSKCYEKNTGENLRKDLRLHLRDIISDKKTALYMKLCIVLYICTPRIFIHMFWILYILTGR